MHVHAMKSRNMIDYEFKNYQCVYHCPGIQAKTMIVVHSPSSDTGNDQIIISPIKFIFSVLMVSFTLDKTTRICTCFFFTLILKVKGIILNIDFSKQIAVIQTLL